jgi:hypothetical protein
MALNISYAMWGALFAWSLHQTPVTLLAIGGCAVVTAGAVATILSGGIENSNDRKGRLKDRPTPLRRS